MSRAVPLSPAARREAIVAATLPLLAERGAEVTTSEIARAAGIAEGTIFRVFADKRQLLETALCSAMSADAEVARIGAIPRELPLEERLVAGLAAIKGYHDRLWALIRTFRELGWQPDPHRSEKDERSPRHQMARIGAAMAGLFESHRGSLRQDACTAAQLLLGLAFANRIQERSGGEPPLSHEQLVDLFLHGVLKAEPHA
jgi:AcrR family transcriptional regulator